MVKDFIRYLNRHASLFVLLLALAATAVAIVFIIGSGKLGSFIGYAKSEEGYRASSALLSALGMVVSAAIGILTAQLAREYQYEKDYKALYASVLAPLAKELDSLVNYMESEAAQRCDLGRYDPRRSACDIKLRQVSAYTDELAQLLNKLDSPAVSEPLARQSGVLRLWLLNVGNLQREERPLAGKNPSDGEALKAMKELTRLIG